MNSVSEQKPEEITEFLDIDVDPECEMEIIDGSWPLIKNYFRQQGRKGMLDSLAARDREVSLLKKELADTKVALAVAVGNATVLEKDFQRKLENQRRESDQIQGYLQDQVEGYKRINDKLAKPPHEDIAGKKSQQELSLQERQLASQERIASIQADSAKEIARIQAEAQERQLKIQAETQQRQVEAQQKQFETLKNLVSLVAGNSGFPRGVVDGGRQ